MDKARICVNQAKEIARRKSIKDGQKLLVYNKSRKGLGNEVKKVYNLGACTGPTVKKIKVCTGAELKKMCPLTPPCKPPPAPDDSLALIARIIWFALKAAVAGGIVILTYQAGVWGDNDETQALYERLCRYFSGKDEEEDENQDEEYKIVLGYCNQNKIFMEPSEEFDNKCPLPTDDSNLYYFQRKWNEMIKEVGNIILSGPKAFIYTAGTWFKFDEDPDVEESKKKAEAVFANKVDVEEYNKRVHKYEEDKLKEREERILKLKKRYERRLKIMQEQPDGGEPLPSALADEEPEVPAEPERSC